jgi:hypothetical protein
MAINWFISRIVQHTLRQYESRDYLGFDHPLQGKGATPGRGAPFRFSGTIPGVGV